VKRYSVFRIFLEGLRGNRGWEPLWENPEPKKEYDIIIIGGGGHGLATAYYLAKEHNMKNIAVLEKGWLGGGNTGRNTTIIRSNYMIPGNTKFYERSMKLWEQLSHELNYNIMFSQRGQYNLLHSRSALDAARRRGNIMRSNGIDAELLTRETLQQRLSYLDFSKNARFPIEGALYQSRAGTARHDAVAWGYARAANALGVDIIQNCEVEGFIFKAGTIIGVKTKKGLIKAKKIGVAVAGHTSLLGRMAGLRLPIETHTIQAFVSEPLKPLVDCVIASGEVHVCISQSDKGGLVLGSDLDGYNSYTQRGGEPVFENTLARATLLIPSLSRIRILRQWAGLVDMTMDGSPIICKSPIEGLYINGGWNYGGFKATPASGWCFAWTIARGEPHEDNAMFTLNRFQKGLQIDEKGAGPAPHAH